MIVVTGEALVDLLIDEAGSVRAALGGGPFNAARTIARLGRAVTFYGAVSNDRFGSLLAAELQTDGVDPLLTVRTDRPTTLAAAELDAHGAASYHFYFDGTSAPALPTVDLPVDVRIVHAGTLGLVLEPMASVTETMIASLPAEVVVLIDLNCRPKVITDRDAYLARVERILARADVVKVSTDDLEYLVGVDPVTGATAPGAIDEWIERVLTLGPTVVLHTDGGRSTWVRHRGSSIEVPVPRIEVVDTVGAGDSFGGAFLARWDLLGLGRSELADTSLVRDASALAVQVAALTCQRVGADPPRVAELGDLWTR